MKSYRKWTWLTALMLCAFVAANGWDENVESGSKLEAVFYQAFGGTIARRAPKETRADLSRLIEQTPREADLYSLRALEAEQQLDFPAAESDWKKYVELSNDKAAAQLALADYYHRRLQPSGELAALRAVAAAAKDDPFLNPQDQLGWQAFTRIAALIDDQAIDSAAPEQYQAWVARYPKEPQAYRTACLALIKKQYAPAESILGLYESAFPGSPEFPTQVRAAIEFAKGSPERALAVYDSAFRPLWPDELATAHFALLKELGRTRQVLDQLRAAAASAPTDLTAAARLYDFYRQRTDVTSAVKVLNEFCKAKTNWTPDEHETVARLFDQSNQYDDAARHYHALYLLAPGNEAGLAGLANLMLTASEQSIQIGAGNLGFYRDIARMDRGPGFLNGVLSLLLNSQSPQREYDKENGQALSYFHRVKAGQLVALFEQRYPTSVRRASLRAKLIQVYATYGDANGVIANGTKFLSSYPDASERTEIALMMADAYTRLDRTKEEFSLYQDLLSELGKRANGRPIGTITAETGEPRQPAADTPDDSHTDRALSLVEGADAPKPPSVRSQDYVRVLDRYLARLVSLKRLPEALAVYRGELTRNASDAGLYERFAAFLDQNKMGADVERTYRDAMKRFPDDKSWTQKLARWYLREKQVTQYAALTREVTKIFSGSDLEQYFRVTADGSIGSQMYLQLNLYAHQRFPHNLTFVRNLLDAYTNRTTSNPQAYEALLRQNWFEAPDLRSRFFEQLSRTNRLDVELAALEAQKPSPETNPAATRMLAEAEAWKTHFESAATAFRLLAASYPAQTQLDERAAALHRSLDLIPTSIEIETNLAKADPRNHDPITRIGEMQAERDRFDLASPYFIRLASIEPGKPDGYLESATVFWDYYRFDDALQMIEKARRKFGNPALYSYEAGAIHENQRDYAAALNEYARGAIAEGEGPSRQRLLRLAGRPSLSALAESVTARLGATQAPANIGLRIAVLEAQSRAAALKQYLSSVTAATSSVDVLSTVEQSARTNEFADVTRAVLEKRLTIISDPAERLRARMELVRFFEGQNDESRAAQLIDTIYRENPTTLGAIRSAVSYCTRARQPGKAIDILTAAADRAQQPYEDHFRFEAAHMCIDAGQLDRAQTLLAGLLTKEPYRADYIAANASLFEKRGDDAALRTYYNSAIDSLRNAPLSANDRVARVASLQRALVPVLLRLKDAAGALDQYIEVLNRYPEDESLTQEVALFAQRNGQSQRLLDACTKTAAASPKDYRWPLVVSRIETVYEDLPAALTWLGKARGVRPERTDLLAAKGLIEERLMRFEEAAATYKALFDLSYRNPHWMMKSAEQYLRLDRKVDAVAAIRTGWIEGRPETAANYWECARQAQAWNLLDEAQAFADNGLKLAPDHTDLLAVNGELAAQRHRPLPLLPGGLELFAKASIERRWGLAVARYATPDDKVLLTARLRPADKDLALAAGFAELRARWEPELSENYPNQGLVTIERQRARFDELAARFEAAARNPKLTPAQRSPLLNAALQYYELMENNTASLRILELLKSANALNGQNLDQYAKLMARSPTRAAILAGGDADATLRDMVANHVLDNGRASDALNIVSARGTGLRPVWTNAYTALTGLYFGLNTPSIRTAFASLMGPQTVAGQLTGAPDEDQQVTGQAWYYYAARYGEYLTAKEGESYLLAQLEQAPGDVNGYSNLASHYLETGNIARASEEYDYVLQLSPSNAAAHTNKAYVFAQLGRINDAVAEWKAAFEGLASDPTSAGDIQSALTGAAHFKEFGQIRDSAGTVLKAYFKKNGAYNADGLIEAAYRAGGANWLVDILSQAPEPGEALRLALNGNWLTATPERDELHARLVQIATARANASLGQDRQGLIDAALQYRLDWIRDRLLHGNFEGAESLFSQLPERSRAADLEIAIAAHRNTIGPLLQRYKRDRERAPSMEQIRQAAAQLRATLPDASDQLMEFVCSEELNDRQFTAANFLGLAEIKLKHNDLPGALELLRRMNLMVGEPFDLLNESAGLLARTGHSFEAMQYYGQLAKVRPWDAQAKLDDAQADPAAIARDASAPYAIRAQAALRSKAPTVTGVSELDLLSNQQSITEAQASKPFFLEARKALSSATKDPELRYRLLSQAVAMEPSVELRRALFEAAYATRRFALADALSGEFENVPEMLHDLAAVKHQKGDLASALRLERLFGERSQPSARALAQQTILRWQREAALIELNQGRRPMISENILPDRVVKRRLAALPANARGGAQ